MKMKGFALLIVAGGHIAISGCPSVEPVQQCDAGQCANIFADGSVACCEDTHPYYCDGGDEGEGSPAEGCYTTWEDAYYGNPCTLPADRVCY